jgi:hypothetical protein
LWNQLPTPEVAVGLLVILLVVGALAVGSYLLYGRSPRSTGRIEGLPEASIHRKDDVTDTWAAADGFRGTAGDAYGGGF